MIAIVWGLLLAGATVCEELEKVIPNWSPNFRPPSILPPQYPESITKPQTNVETPKPKHTLERSNVLGTLASIEEFPGIVQIESGFGPFWTQSGAGSIITSRHVLTAARCFERFPNVRFHRIRAGSSTRSTGVIVTIERVVTHPSFNTQNDGDIAVVKMSSSLDFSPSIQRASIVASGFDLIGGVPVVVAGWGLTAQGEVKTNDLHKITLTSIDNGSCAKTWRTRMPIHVVTSNMICIGQQETGGRNYGTRDLGAPVYYANIVVGVMSWGKVIGKQQYPAVATAVSPYTAWIVANAV